MKKYMIVLLILASMFSSNLGFTQNKTKHYRKSTPCNTMAMSPKHHYGKRVAKHHAVKKHPVRRVEETIAVDDHYSTAIVSIKDGNVYINDSLVTTVKNPKNEDHRLIISYITPPPPAPVTVIEHEKVNTYTGEKAEPMLGVLGTDDGAMNGVLVDDILPCGPAAKAGLYRGDVITKVNDRDIKNGDDLRSAMGTLNPGDVVSVTIKDFDGTETRKVELAKKQEPTSCGCHIPYRHW